MRARGSVLAVIVAIASCRVQEPGPPPAGSGAERGGAAQRGVVEPTAREGQAQAREPASVEAVEPEPRPPEVAVEAPVEREPVPPPQVVVPITTPFSPTAVIVQPAYDSWPVVLFADELAAVRRRAAQVLAAEGIELVPIAELERIEAAAAEGRLVLEGNQQCRAPLTFEEVEARYFPGRRHASVGAECVDECRLRVFVDGPTEQEESQAWQSPPVARPHDPRAWLKAASRLQSVEWLMGGLGLVGTGHSAPVHFEELYGIGPWAAGEPELAPFRALEGTVAACAHPDPLVGFHWQLRASVDRSGRVTRCTADTEHPMAHAGGGTCLCDAVQTLQLAAGAKGRRLRVEAYDEGGSASTGRLALVQPGTETWVTRLQQAPALTRCLDAHPQPKKLSARVILALAPDGGVDDVRIEGDITTTPAMQLASCLVQELRTVPLPCRPPGVEALHLSLDI